MTSSPRPGDPPDPAAAPTAEVPAAAAPAAAASAPAAEVLPDGVRHVRTTPVFDRRSVPAGLLAAHRLAAGVWARLVVSEGSLDFVFEDLPDQPQHVTTGESFVVPPQRSHHVVITGPVLFALELYR